MMMAQNTIKNQTCVKIFNNDSGTTSIQKTKNKLSLLMIGWFIIIWI